MMIKTQGAIAAGHPQTAAAGAEILQHGGNAVDAAVAATFASFVTEPTLVNIGGGGVAQLYSPTDNQSLIYDFFSNMPGLTGNGATPTGKLDFREIFANFGATVQAFHIGRGSVAVPGVVAGLCAMLQERGSLPLAAVLAPTIRLAREGVRLNKSQAYTLTLLEPILTDTPEIAAIHAPSGQLAKEGDMLHFSGLADTLDELAQEGPSFYYTGPVAQAIVADQQANGGLLTRADLERFQVFHLPPIRVDYRGFTVQLPPPSSAGGVLIAFALKLLNTVSLSNLEHNGFDHAKILAEVMRLANIARANWQTTAAQAWPHLPGSTNQIIGALLDDDNLRHYVDKLRQILVTGDAPPEPAHPKGPPNTTHISVADADGMVVSITTSAGENAGFVVGNTGLMLNNMLGEIDLHPDGFHRLPPGQRLMTMMSPTLVLRHGRPVLAVGSGGSNRLRSAILQVISNVIDFDMPINAAVEAPRIHFEDNELQLEGGFDPAVADQLEAAGYAINRWPARNMFFGGTHAVARQSMNDANSKWIAAGDPRRGGSTLVV